VVGFESRPLIIITTTATTTIAAAAAAIEFSLGGSSPYSSRDKTNKNIHK
jgi:hypothetical protein